MMESLPAYVEGQAPQSPFDALFTRISAPLLARHPDARIVLESFTDSQKAPTYNASENPQLPPKAIDEYPLTLNADNDGAAENKTLLHVKQAVVDELYKAIRREDNESIGLLIQHNIVSVNVTSRTGQTPLLAAIMMKNVGTVKQLLELGADPNMFGQIGVTVDSKDTQTRTPLMLAARIGSLPIVRLLFEPPHSANDALVAPDGQIALRLAAEHDHRMIVDYLPSRRGGSFLRFKTRNADNIARAKKALRGIYRFIKFFVWHIPKFIIWDVPKHGVVLPVIEGCKWSWDNRKRFGKWCKRQAIELPKKMWRGIKKIPKGILNAGKTIVQGLGAILLDLVKSIVNFIKILPKLAVDVGKALWKFLTQTLPAWLKAIAIWLWEMLTKRIPQAIGIGLEWIWDLVKSLALAIRGLFVSVASFLHTTLLAAMTFLRNVKLRDVWNSFCDVLSSIFVTFPKILWSWIKKFGMASLEAMYALWGWFGVLLWAIGAGLFHLAIYIPRKIWTILQSFGNSMAKGAHEIWVWINPKA